MRTALICLAVLALSASPAAGAVRPPGSSAPLGDERLSDERTLTRWAHPVSLATVRDAPSTEGRRITTLRAATEDGLPEVYLTLRSRRAADGRVWLKLRLPARPNGRTGWVPRTALGPLRIVRTSLLIERRAQRATLRRGGRVVWRSPVGVGAVGTPTPAGRFYIREKLSNHGGPPLYGPWAFGTSAYSALSEWPGGGVVGIHGTDRPDLIPGRPSHGCVRVPNPAIRRLARLMPVGTPVLIR